MPGKALEAEPQGVAADARVEMLLNLELSAASMLLIVWTLLPHGLWHHVGFLAFTWPVLAYWLRLRRSPTRRETTPKPVQGRLAEVHDGIRTFALAVPLLIYVEWSRRVGVQPLVSLGSVLFLLGALIAFSSLWSAQQPPFVGWGIALASVGLAVPWAMPHSSVSADAMIGAAGVIGGVWGAATYWSWLARIPRAAQR